MYTDLWGALDTVATKCRTPRGPGWRQLARYDPSSSRVDGGPQEHGGEDVESGRDRVGQCVRVEDERLDVAEQEGAEHVLDRAEAEDGEGEHHPVGVLLADLGDEEHAQARAGAAAEGVAHLEALQAVAVLGLLPTMSSTESMNSAPSV